MGSEFNLPKRSQKITIVTDMMREMINRTLAVHTLSALVLWYGQARIGKTTTARYMVEEINKLFYEDMNLPPFSGQRDKLLIELHAACFNCA